MARGRGRLDKNIEPNKLVLVLCEGHGEVAYFNGIKLDDEYKRQLASVGIDIHQPQNYSPLGLVKHAIEKQEEAKREKNEYDSIWVCFDKDGHANIPHALKLANQNGIDVAFSSVCFEYWILLHFENTTKGYRKCDELISYIKANHLKNYNKTDSNFQILKPRKDDAIKYAKQIVRNIPPGENKLTVSAYTDVHELVVYLTNLNQ